MKKVFLSFFLMLPLFMVLLLRFSLVLKLVQTIATLAGDDAPDEAKSKIGFNAGVFAEIPVSEQFSVKLN